MSRGIYLGDHPVGSGSKAIIIGEVAQAHDGQVDLAHAYIDMAARAGLDGVKFQTHLARAESTLDEPFRAPISGFASRYDYWKAMEFSPAEWAGIVEKAKAQNLLFVTSVFSPEAIECFPPSSVDAWKIASGEALTSHLVPSLVVTGKPLLISTGMSTWTEISELVQHVEKADCDYLVFQTTSLYPTQLSQIGLNVLDEYRNRFGCPVGLSDHSGMIWPSVAALARGVDAIEVHMKHDGSRGIDASASLDESQLKLLVSARDAIDEMLQNPVDKDVMSRNLEEMRLIFGKSIATFHPIKAGTTLTRDMLTLKKPGTGIPPDDLEDVVGRRVVRDLVPDRLLEWDDLDA